MAIPSEHLLVWQFISAEVLDGFDDVEELVFDPHELGSSSSLCDFRAQEKYVFNEGMNIME